MEGRWLVWACGYESISKELGTLVKLKCGTWISGLPVVPLFVFAVLFGIQQAWGICSAVALPTFSLEEYPETML